VVVEGVDKGWIGGAGGGESGAFPARAVTASVRPSSAKGKKKTQPPTKNHHRPPTIPRASHHTKNATTHQKPPPTTDHPPRVTPHHPKSNTTQSKGLRSAFTKSAPATPDAGAHQPVTAHLGRVSIASSWAGSETSLGGRGGGGGGGGGYARSSGHGTDTTLGGGWGPTARDLTRTSSIARRPVASGQWVSRKRDWWGNSNGGGGGDGCDDSTSMGGGGGPPIPPHVILPNERGYLYWFLITLVAAMWVSVLYCFTFGGAARRVCLFFPSIPSHLHPSALTTSPKIITPQTGFFDPYCIAFSRNPGLFPYVDAQAIVAYLITAIFAADVAVRFRLAYVDDDGRLVTSSRAIAHRYARSGMLAVDLLAAIPFDWIAIAVVAPGGEDTRTARWLTLIGLLRLLRLYRVREALVAAEANLAISLLAATIARNLAYVFYLAHWAACGFYFCARMAGFGPATWVGRASAGAGVAALGSAPGLPASTPDRYLASLYWAVTVFTTTGFGDLVAVSPAETVWTIFYMVAALVLGTYIIGTTTLLLIKGDSAKGAYRDRAAALRTYAHLNSLPPALEAAMHEHLRLAHSNADIADDAVLGGLPATLRRRALRHLYAAPLKNSYLLRGVRQRYLDALLAVASVELLMAHVDVIGDGDHVPDLMFLVSGSLEVTLPGGAEAGEDLPLIGRTAGGAASGGGGYDPNRSVRLGVRRQLGPGDPVGEVSFFTEVPSCGIVRTSTVSRLLVIPRSAWEHVAADFPLGTRAVLDNLRGRAQEAVDVEFRGAAGAALLAAAPANIAHAQASAEAGRGGGGGGKGGAPGGAGGVSGPTAAMSPVQERALSDLLRVRALATTVLAKSDERRTQAFLGAASRGDTTTVRAMLQQRFDPDSADYDARSALALAAAKGHLDIVTLLLASQANPNLVDNLNSSPLMEACKAGHDGVIRALIAGGATWHLGTVATASELCTCVFEGNLPLLRRFIAAGARADAGDYDERTPLHIACCGEFSCLFQCFVCLDLHPSPPLPPLTAPAKPNHTPSPENALSAVKLLVDGGANISALDRFGSTPLDEAVRVGARPVAAYLTELGADTAKADERTARFLNAAAAGDSTTLRFMIDNGQPPCSADYDRRDALMLAVGGGHFEAATTLLGAGASASATDAFGGSALTEAIKLRRADLVSLLTSAGARLGWEEARMASTLCQAASEGDVALLGLYFSAGASGDEGDYDSRRALHIAAADGKGEALASLIKAGADINCTDRWGATPLLEAVKAVASGKAGPALIDQVRAAGGLLTLEPHALSGILCSAVHARDLALVRLYLRAGAAPDAADYDDRTALHVAAAEGSLDIVRALVEDGGAGAGVRDRWGHTPLDEARREKRGPVVEYLARLPAAGR
jgi:ankyrin repeat protein/CRP-like cAMP-binding protein